MASSFPLKLHDFELPEAWGYNSQSTKRSRYYKAPSKNEEAAPTSPPPPPPPQETAILAATSPPPHSQSSESPLIPPSAEGDCSKKQSQEILLRSPPASGDFELLEAAFCKEEGHVVGRRGKMKAKEDEPKLRELRPLKQRLKLTMKKGSSKDEASGSVSGVESQVKMGGSSGGKEKLMEDDKGEKVEVKKKKKKKKLGITISLTKREIEEDIFTLTGAMPSTRPKKHTKIVQLNLNSAFPGLDMSSITAERYRRSGSSS